MVLLRKFDKCLCTDLRNGTIIIGVLGLIWGVYFTSAAFLQIDTGHTTAKHKDGPGETFVMVVKVVFGLLEIIISSLLIYGAVKRIPKLVFPWICVTLVASVLQFILYIILGILACVGGALGLGFSLIIGAIIGGLIQLYCISVVNSFHTSIKNGQPVPTNGPA